MISLGHSPRELLVVFNSQFPRWVKGYLPNAPAPDMVAVPQIAADLLHRASRQRRAKPAAL
jgi:hypothetical protein